MSTQAFIPYIGVCGLLIKDSKVLLTHRAEAIYGGNSYSLPGGHVDGNEAIRTALARELHEELDISINPDDAQFFHVSHQKSPHREYVSFFFVIRTWQGELANKEPEKHTHLDWFDLHDIPENTLYREVFAMYLDKIYYSERGW